MAERVQRSRKRGWRMPPDSVYVGRPSRYGNPWKIVRDVEGVWRVHSPNGVTYAWCDSKTDAADAAVKLFRLFTAPTLDVGPLVGKDLVCWCPPDLPCHADVLLELAARHEGHG
jgi:hypothetical protein